MFSPRCHAIESGGSAIHSLSFVYIILKGERERESGPCFCMANRARRSTGMHFVAQWAEPGTALVRTPLHGSWAGQSVGQKRLGSVTLRTI
jgi:hypothetical protein